MDKLIKEMDFLSKAERLRLLSTTAAAAPLAGGEIQFLPEEAREVKLIFEPCLRGNFLNRQFAFSEQAAGADEPEFEQVLVRAQTGVGGESMAERTVTHPEFARQKLHVQMMRELALDAGDGGFDSIGVLRIGGGLRLLRGINQAHQIVRRARQDLLECRAIRADGLHYPAEGGKHSVFRIHLENGVFGSEKSVPKPAAGNFAIESNPVLVPAGFRVGGIAMPDSWKKQDRMSRLENRGWT